MKAILTIQSQVAGARVGNGAACFAIERLGLRAIPLPTTLLGRRPDRGPPGGGPVPTGLLQSMFAALEADGALAGIDVLLSGYIADVEQIDFILYAVARLKAANPQAIYVCDPVMGDGKPYVSDEIAGAMVAKLIPAADLVTPNLWELVTITGLPCDTIVTARRAALTLNRPCLITSAPTPSGTGALYCSIKASWLVETPRAPAAPKGTRDLFTALFVAQRLLGKSTAVALEAAAGATYDVILRSLAEGGDHLALIEAQDKLAEPDTWPTAQPVNA